MAIARFGPDDRALSRKETAAKTSLSCAEVDRRAETDPRFPKPFNVGPRRRAYMLSDIMAWLEQQAAATPAIAGGYDDI